ncbi:phenylalanyl-tRNA synthetase subunit alpha [Streptococcus pneumoniae GA02270]|nr:phenylalanyl-tRNA synthetase subunit alpha [Streptococcus pneumoniae GA02270]
MRKQKGEYLRAENAIPKKVKGTPIEGGKEKEERQKLFKN